MIRKILYILILGVFSGWISVCHAQSDPKNPIPQSSGVNPSEAKAPSPLDDPKMPADLRASLKNENTQNPSNPPVSAPDQKQVLIVPDQNTGKGSAPADPLPVHPEPSAASAPDNGQPEGEKPASVTDYRSLKGDPSQEMPSETAPGTDYRNLNGSREQALPDDKNQSDKTN
jgi:hypothetical protein